VHRVYHEAKTPYQWLRESGVLKPKQRAELKSRYEALNPAKLHREIEALRNQLFDLVESQNEQSLPRARRHGPGLTSQARATSAIEAPSSSRLTAASLNSFVNILRDRLMTLFSI